MGNYYLYRIGQFLAKILPLKVSSCLVMALCDLHYCFSKRDRRAVENNLRIVTGTEKVPPREVRAVFRNFGKYLLEFFTLDKRLNKEFLESKVHVKNIEYLHEALRKGKGGFLSARMWATGKWVPRFCRCWVSLFPSWPWPTATRGSMPFLTPSGRPLGSRSSRRMWRQEG